MICNDCTKKEVCKYKERAERWETEINKIAEDPEGLFATQLNCKHKDAGSKIRNPLSPSFPPQPLGPWIFQRQPYSPTSPYDRRITWDGRPEITCGGTE